ncbi:MAG TPA: sodium/proton-translocating pyrophosphatase, partial [Candidatus Brocadiales bacterium]|nr:sodium/proton-translocating pyrophosphatase [Candidatus Brocadiales bacterium]
MKKLSKATQGLAIVIVFGVIFFLAKTSTGAVPQQGYPPQGVVTVSPEKQESKERNIPLIWWLAPIGAIAALVFARKFYKGVMQNSAGDAKMVEVANHVREGAFAYLKQQYTVVA